MFRNLLSRLFTDDPQSPPLASADAEVAVVALLVRLARSDDHYSTVEQSRIDRILARRCGLNAKEAAARRAAAEMIEAEAPDTVRFTRVVKDRISLDDRLGIIGAMWEVAYADNERNADEESLIRLVTGLLGVNDRDSAVSRQQVLSQMGLSDG